MRIWRLVVAFLVFGIHAAVAEAQQGTSAIRGRALDEQGAAIPGVTIVVTHRETGIFRDTVTGADGTYSVTNLVPGTYRVTAELQGFRKLTRENLALTAGLTLSQDLVLQVGSVEESVTVSGQAPQVDLTTAAAGGHVSLNELEALPAISHQVTGFLQVVPGVVYTAPTTKPSLDALTVNGSSAGVHYYLDGGVNYSGAVGSSFSRVMVPSDVVQEVVAITSQVPAEYGGRTGAAFNVISKQGTNAFRGSAYGFYSGGKLIGADPLVAENHLTKPDVSKGLSGATLGGPLLRDKLFFFADLEYTSQGKVSPQIFPSNPDKTYTPNALAKGWDTFVRVDHQLNANNTYAFRYLGRKAGCTGDAGCRAGGAGPTLPTNASAFAAVGQEWEYDSLVVANYNRVISSTKLNVFTFSTPKQSIQTSQPSSSPGAETICVPCLPPTLRYLSFDDQVGYFDHHRWEPQYRFEDSFSWHKGSHDLKFGALYNWASHTVISHDAENGIFTFAGNTYFNPANPATYPEQLTIRVSPQNSANGYHWAAGYAQDKWQAITNLTLTLGLRYDLFLTKTPNQFNPLFTDRNSRGPIDWNNYGPRLGFAYGSSEGKAVLRGGFGVSYQAPSISTDIDNFYRLGVYGNGLVVTFPSSGVPDPGPSAGRLPTNPMLLSMGPSGPVVNRALLNQIYPPDTLIRNTNTAYLDNPARRIARSSQTTVGYQREFFGNLAFTADYVHIQGSHDSVFYDLNPGLRASTSRTAPITRSDLMGIADQLAISPFSTSLFTVLSNGEDRYDGLNLQLDKRFARSWSARLAYTLSRCTNDTDAGNNFQVLAAQNLTWGPCSSDRTHVLSLSGSYDIPRTGGMRVTGSLRALSGTPFTIQNTAVDVNRNGILVDPLPAGTYSGSGANALTVLDAGGWNGARGPRFHEIDLRLGYRFHLSGARVVDFSADCFNVTNAPNFSNPTGDLRQPTFLVPTALVSGGLPRQLQFTARIAF
jgi:hypothetical protein